MDWEWRRGYSSKEIFITVLTEGCFAKEKKVYFIVRFFQAEIFKRY